MSKGKAYGPKEAVENMAKYNPFPLGNAGMPMPSLAPRKNDVQDFEEKLQRYERFSENLKAAKFYFKEVWLKNSPDYSSYDWVEISGPSYIIEVFAYVEDRSEDAFKSDKEMAEVLGVTDPDVPVIFPVGRILKVGDGFSESQAVYAVGDLVWLPNSVSYVEINPAWLEAQDKLVKTRPTPNIMMPPKYMGKIMEWNARNRVPKSVMDPYDDSGFVFKLPAAIIEGKVNKHAIH